MRNSLLLVFQPLSRPSDRLVTFCVDADHLESGITLGFIDSATDYNSLTKPKLHAHLDKKAEYSKESVILDAFDKIVDKDLKMNMTDRSSKSSVENWFVLYHSIIRCKGLQWLLKNTRKVCVYLALSAICLRSLRKRLESDLNFAYNNLKKDFHNLSSHAFKMFELFKLVNAGTPLDNNSGRAPGKNNSFNRSENKYNNFGADKNNSNPIGKKRSKQLLMCLYPPCK